MKVISEVQQQCDFICALQFYVKELHRIPAHNSSQNCGEIVCPTAKSTSTVLQIAESRESKLFNFYFVSEAPKF